MPLICRHFEQLVGDLEVREEAINFSLKFTFQVSRPCVFYAERSFYISAALAIVRVYVSLLRWPRFLDCDQSRRGKKNHLISSVPARCLVRQK